MRSLSCQDMTSGPLGKQILLFSLPLICSNLLQVLFNLADLAVVGQFVGSEALGSVGSTTTLVTMFTGFLIGLGGGINVLAARFFGARDDKRFGQLLHTAAILSLGLGILLSILGVAFTRSILQLLQTKEDLLDGAALYLRIYLLGMPAMAIYNYGSAIMSALGDTRRPLRFLTIAGVPQCDSQLVLCAGGTPGSGRRSAGQHHFPVPLGGADPAGADAQRCPLRP